MISSAVTWVLTTLIGNRFLLNRKSKFGQKYMQQRWLRTPIAMGIGAVATYGINLALMR